MIEKIIKELIKIFLYNLIKMIERPKKIIRRKKAVLSPDRNIARKYIEKKIVYKIEYFFKSNLLRMIVIKIIGKNFKRKLPKIKFCSNSPAILP